jgi:hypothetical protein
MDLKNHRNNNSISKLRKKNKIKLNIFYLILFNANNICQEI